MAMTHKDSDFNRAFLEELKQRADKMQKNRQSEITTGKPDEKPLLRWIHGGIEVTHMPDDPQKILRISVGGGDHLPVVCNYCTIRGPVGQCIDLLEKTLAALKACPE